MRRKIVNVSKELLILLIYVALQQSVRSLRPLTLMLLGTLASAICILTLALQVRETDIQEIMMEYREREDSDAGDVPSRLWEILMDQRRSRELVFLFHFFVFVK